MSRRSSGTLDMMLMSLLVNNVELSGYEFSTLLQNPVPFIWPVKHSQIYPALAALEARGDLLATWVDQQGRPNKKTYTLTPQGLERLKGWLTAPRDALSEDEAMLLAYNSHLLGTDILLGAMKAYRHQCETEIASLEARWRRARDEHYTALQRAGVRAVYEFAIKTREARLAWCDWVADQVTPR
jgi:DNA-binding PadR family transcriptional regulator